MVEWIPVLGTSGSLASLADGTAAVAWTVPLQEPITAEDLDPGTIVNGWLDVTVYTSDAAALSTSRGPVQFFMFLIPKVFSGDATKVQTAAELKEYDDVAWMMIQGWLEGGATNIIHVRFMLNTLRKYARGYKLVLICQNNTGAAFPATTLVDTLGEIYVQYEA